MATKKKRSVGRPPGKVLTEHIARIPMRSVTWKALAKEAYFTDTTVSAIVRDLIAKHQSEIRHEAD